METDRIDDRFENTFPAVTKAFQVLENRYHINQSASKVKTINPYQIDKTAFFKGIASETLKTCESQFPSRKIKIGHVKH